MSHLHQIRLRHTYWLILKMIEAYAMNSLAKLCQRFPEDETVREALGRSRRNEPAAVEDDHER
jgi:hypothetical protein